ncbi:hypothetical protein Tco_1235109 [Tanacetum coccineum]
MASSALYVIRGTLENSSEVTSLVQRENEREYRCRERDISSEIKNKEPLESEDSVRGRHWKRRSRKAQRRADTDLSKPYNKDVTPVN